MSVQIAAAQRLEGTRGIEVRARHRSRPARLMAAGGAVMVLAVGLGVGSVADHGDPAYSNNKVVEPAVPRLPVEEVTVQMAYAPGESSGWHVHPVNHIIEVVSGDLEAYDAACELRIYGPGTTYVGGTQSHMIRNNGVVAVEMVVKRIESPVAGYSVTRLTPPEGCPVA